MRTTEELEKKLEEMKQLRSDGTVPLREDQKFLDRAIDKIESELKRRRDDEVDQWMRGNTKEIEIEASEA